jgi:hypothetical protein
MDYVIAFLVLVAVALELFTLYRLNKERVTFGESNDELLREVAGELTKLYRSIHIALEARGINLAGVSPGNEAAEPTEEELKRQAAIRKAEMFLKVRRRS